MVAQCHSQLAVYTGIPFLDQKMVRSGLVIKNSHFSSLNLNPKIFNSFADFLYKVKMLSHFLLKYHLNIHKQNLNLTTLCLLFVEKCQVPP